MTASKNTQPRKSIAEHVHNFETREIRLEVEGTKLRVVAPLGLMSDADREFIRANRDLIIGHLNGEEETFTA